MKALSVWQPWAWLIVNGFKGVENRGWFLSRRGPIAIHAGKKMGPEQMEDYECIRDLYPDITMPALRDMQLGGLVGTAEAYDCVSKEGAVPPDQRRWFNGPYGILLRNQRVCTFVPVRGQLGLFDVEDGMIQLIENPLRSAGSDDRNG